MVKTYDFSSNSTFNPTPHNTVIAEKQTDVSAAKNEAPAIKPYVGVADKKPETVRAEEIYPEYRSVIKPMAFHSPRAEYEVDKKRQANDEEQSAADSPLAMVEENEVPAPPPDKGFKYINKTVSEIPHSEIKMTVTVEPEPEKEIRVIGEFSATYIICEAENQLILIDKHAAHERIRFEQLKEEFRDTSQLLIDNTEIVLSAEQYNALNEYYSFVEQTGTELIFGDNLTVAVTAMPSVVKCSAEELVCLIADRLINGSTEQAGAMYDDILHTMACKSAIKANDRTDIAELWALARRVYNDEKIRFCPHGRPVMIALSKGKIEHFFGRS